MNKEMNRIFSWKAVVNIVWLTKVYGLSGFIETEIDRLRGL